MLVLGEGMGGGGRGDNLPDQLDVMVIRSRPLFAGGLRARAPVYARS